MRALPLFRRHRQSRSGGQSLVEFALVLPVFLLFLAATLDLGRVFYANITLNNAAREGAFQAAITPDLYQADQPCNQATNRVVCRIQNETTGSMITVAPTDIDMTCHLAGCPKSAGSFVTVEVRGQFRLVTPLLSVIFGGQTLDLTSSAIAQIEYLPDPDTATLPPGPVAQFIWSPDDPDEGEVVSFDPDTSTGSPTGYQWDLDGDGVVDSTDQYPTHTYATAGDYDVSLTIVNLSGVSTVIHTVTVVGPSPDPSSSPTTAPTPSCAFPPNVIGQTPNNAAILLQQAGFNNVQSFNDLTTGTKNRIQAQNPDHTQCIPLATLITLHYRPN
jgi:Flp pilus assembly protein TadG